jgi:hypothetical protein
MAIRKLRLQWRNSYGRAGSRFYSTPGVGLNQVRIAYVLKKEDLIKAVQI